MSETDVEPSSGNIFADIGLPDADAHLFKAQIVAALQDSMRAQGLTQAAAAERMGLKQPDVSKLMRGNFSGFSYERLFGLLTALGHVVTVEVQPANRDLTSGRLRLAAGRGPSTPRRATKKDRSELTPDGKGRRVLA